MWLVMIVVVMMPEQITTGREKVISTHTDIDNDNTIEGKTTVKPLAKVIQRKKELSSPILIAGFPGPGLVGSIRLLTSLTNYR